MRSVLKPGRRYNSAMARFLCHVSSLGIIIVAVIPDSRAGNRGLSMRLWQFLQLNLKQKYFH